MGVEMVQEIHARAFNTKQMLIYLTIGHKVLIFFTFLNLYKLRNPPDGGSMSTTESKLTITDKTSMLEYLSTEISTLTTNTMTFRSRITFSIFVGPFLILGALIILSAKESLTYGPISGWTWKMWIALVVALLGFICLGFISGKIEQGAIVQANQWRRCIILLQSADEFDPKVLETNILDQHGWNAATVYIIAYAALIATFFSIVYLAFQLVHRAG